MSLRRRMLGETDLRLLLLRVRVFLDSVSRRADFTPAWDSPPAIIDTGIDN